MEILKRTFETEYKSDENKIVGYAAKYESPSEDLGWYYKVTEYIEPGAFDRVLIQEDDVRCLLNHDPNYVIGRTKSGTLKLSADKIGLYFECKYDPEISWQADLVRSINRRDVSQCSFAFSYDEEKDADVTVDRENETITRRIKNFSKLYDVSVVTYPAFTSTEAYARDLRKLAEEYENMFTEAEADADRLSLEIECL